MLSSTNKIRGGSRAAATLKIEHFVIIVSGFQPLTIITKRSILDVVVALDPPLVYYAGGLIQRLSDIFHYLKGNQDKNCF